MRSTLRTLFRVIRTEISGLNIYEDFLTKHQRVSIQERADVMCYDISKAVTNKRIISRNHNLDSLEYYSPIKLFDSGKIIHSQHFSKYGNSHHQLTYFKGNDNIPSFARELLIPNVTDLLKLHNVTWNLTLNRYVGKIDFLFHKDIESNGESTAIYSPDSGAVFEICDRDELREYVLPINALLVMSGYARQLKHRVTSSCDKRTSLVLGF